AAATDRTNSFLNAAGAFVDFTILPLSEHVAAFRHVIYFNYRVQGSLLSSDLPYRTVQFVVDYKPLEIELT
ncbi:MAG: hypothetical protein AAGB25_03165, partial [Pseudomonadota bacterium]